MTALPVVRQVWRAGERVMRERSARVALYYAPALDDPLWRAGCAWLGRDPETGRPCSSRDLPDIAAVTADARLTASTPR